MRWLHFGGVLVAVYAIQADYPRWLHFIAVVAFIVNLFIFLMELEEDMRTIEASEA